MSFHPSGLQLQLKLVLGILVVLLSLCSVDASAQQARVKIGVTTNKTLQIEIQQTAATDSWSFLNAVAGTLGLGDRISNFKVSNSSQNVAVRRIASGEYRADGPASECSYGVDLSKPELGNMAHASWMSTSEGILMFADLLPHDLMNRGISVEFTLPAGWRVHSAAATEASRFVISDPEKAVFLVGGATQKQSKKIDGVELTLFVSGHWPFSNSKALDTAVKVFKKYRSVTGYTLRQPAGIFVAPMPVPSALNKWKAETRGSVSVLLIDPTATFPTWNGQLGVIFTHELFHFWIPNSLVLKGDYDWFFEGFSLYQGLLTARDLKLISSQEFLNTIARVFDSYLSYSQKDSLVEASEKRWMNPGSYVYDKGLLVAFMLDLIARSQAGSRPLSEVYRELFVSFADKPADGNEAIIRLLSSSKQARELCERYITGRTQLEFESFLPQFGFRVETRENRSIVIINNSLNYQQRELVRSFGLKP